MKQKIQVIILLLTLCFTNHNVSAKYDYQIEETESLGQQIADFAVQYVGNSYSWGGTSLTNGADCSGFAYAVFGNFDIELPRVSNDQFNDGEVVEFDDKQPGDLIFYGYGSSYSDHTAIYIGNNKIVHAKNSAEGIVISDVDYWNFIGVRRYWK